MKKLASIIAKLEGKKSQARIGDIREILKLYIAVMAANALGSASDEWNAHVARVYDRANELKKDGLTPEQIVAKIAGLK